MTTSNHDERRRSRRVKESLAVRIEGADARGVPFDDGVSSADVSAGGLCLLTKRDLPDGAVLTVTIPGRGLARPGRPRDNFQAQALVVYVLKEGALNRVGVRFVGATLPMPEHS